MTAEQLEELLHKLENGTLDEKMRADMQLDDIATALARRVLAAEKLVALLDVYICGEAEIRDIVRAITAYREASK